MILGHILVFNVLELGLKLKIKNIRNFKIGIRIDFKRILIKITLWWLIKYFFGWWTIQCDFQCRWWITIISGLKEYRIIGIKLKKEILNSISY